MALSDKKIIEAKEAGDIVIWPFDERNLSTSSYDVTLGPAYYAQVNASGQLFNMYSKEHTEKRWILKHAQPIVEAGIPPGDGYNASDSVIVLAPGETILAHTNEFIGGKNHITTMMKARSSMGRQGILVCKCAGWGDVGYVNKWTMEITNASAFTIPLVVNRRIAQIIFFETGEINEKDYTSKGNYANSTDIDKLIKDWKPELMLPKMWNDRDIVR